jgi:hypothetical protein
MIMVYNDENEKVRVIGFMQDDPGDEVGDAEAEAEHELEANEGK